MPVKLFLLWERWRFQVKSILLSLRTAYITQLRGDWEIPHGPERASPGAETSTDFRAEPLHYCHGNCKLNREGMTECSRKWTPGLRCPSLKILMNEYKSVIPCLTKTPESPKIGTAQSHKALPRIFRTYADIGPRLFLVNNIFRFPLNPTTTPFSSFSSSEERF